METVITLGSCLYQTDGTQAPEWPKGGSSTIPHLAPCHTHPALRAPPSATHTAILLSGALPACSVWPSGPADAASSELLSSSQGASDAPSIPFRLPAGFGVCERACEEADPDSSCLLLLARAGKHHRASPVYSFRRPCRKVTESPDLGATVPKPRPGFNTHYPLVLEKCSLVSPVSHLPGREFRSVCRCLFPAPVRKAGRGCCQPRKHKPSLSSSPAVPFDLTGAEKAEENGDCFLSQYHGHSINSAETSFFQGF